jgi:hypothetical protein
MFALIADVKGLNGINDNRTISTGLFLKTGMAVIPVGAALIDIKFVTKSFSWFNAAEMVAYAFQRKTGAGTLPLIAVAIRSLPVKLTFL